MSSSQDLLIPIIRQRLDYDPDSGVLTWKDCGAEFFESEKAYASFKSKFSGKAAGEVSPSGDYRRVFLFKKAHKAHRLAWAIYFGKWPEGVIDHINGDTLDNRIKNLRDCSRSVNSRNSRKYKSNKSGLTGVSWHKSSGKWVAQITINGKRKHLGLFCDKFSAHKAWLSAKNENNFTERHGVDER